MSQVEAALNLGPLYDAKWEPTDPGQIQGRQHCYFHFDLGVIFTPALQAEATP